MNINELLFPMALGVLMFLVICDAWLWQKKMAERKKNEKAVQQMITMKRFADMHAEAGIVKIVDRLYPLTPAPCAPMKYELPTVDGQGPIVAAILNSCYVIVATVFAVKGFNEAAKMHAADQVVIALTKRARGNRPDSWLTDRKAAAEVFEATLAWAAQELQIPVAELSTLREPRAGG